MTDEPKKTPGQVAYEGYRAIKTRFPQPPWTLLDPIQNEQWESAATAVRADLVAEVERLRAVIERVKGVRRLDFCSICEPEDQYVLHKDLANIIKEAGL